MSVGRSRHKLSLVLISVALLISGAIKLATLLQSGKELPTHSREQDLKNHPIYSTYRYSSPEKAVRIGIQPLWVYGGNIAEAMRRDRLLAGKLADLGLAAEFHSFFKGPDINFFMEAGQLDAGMSGFLPTLTLTTRLDVLVPAVIDRNYFDLIALNSLSINELNGRKIGFPLGSDAEQALVEFQETIGIRLDLVPVDLDEVQQVIRSGRIDGYMSWEPITAMLLEHNENASIVYRSLWVSFLSFRKEFVEEHPEATDAILASLARAVRWLRDDRVNHTISSRWTIAAGKGLLGDAQPMGLDSFVLQSRRAAALSGLPELFEVDLADGHLLHHGFTYMQRKGLIPENGDWKKTRAMFDGRKMAAIQGRPHRYRLNDFEYYDIKEHDHE